MQRLRVCWTSRYVSNSANEASPVILKSLGALTTMVGSAGVFVVWALLSFNVAFGAEEARRFFMVALAVAASMAVLGIALLAMSLVLQSGSRRQAEGADSNRA